MLILREVNALNNCCRVYFSRNLQKNLFSVVDTTPQLSESYTSQRKMIEDEVKRDSLSEGTLKMERNNENFITDLELRKKAKSHSDQKFSKDENGSVKNVISSSTSGESYSKKQSVRSMDDRSGSERRRKKKAIDPKLLKYYPNVPGETIKNH